MYNSSSSFSYYNNIPTAPLVKSLFVFRFVSISLDPKYQSSPTMNPTTTSLYINTRTLDQTNSSVTLKHSTTQFFFAYLPSETLQGKTENRMGIESVEMMMLRCVFDGSLSTQNMEIERRPYHKNCSCALHKSKSDSSATPCQQRMVSFTKRTSGNHCCLSMKASKSSTL